MHPKKNRCITFLGGWKNRGLETNAMTLARRQLLYQPICKQILVWPRLWQISNFDTNKYQIWFKLIFVLENIVISTALLFFHLKTLLTWILFIERFFIEKEQEHFSQFFMIFADVFMNCCKRIISDASVQTYERTLHFALYLSMMRPNAVKETPLPHQCSIVLQQCHYCCEGI